MTVKPGKDIHILVNAYMRGGSSFATDLLVGQPSTFYVYEPLWRFSKWGFYTGDGQLCDTLQPKCRYYIYAKYPNAIIPSHILLKFKQVH